MRLEILVNHDLGDDDVRNAGRALPDPVLNADRRQHHRSERLNHWLTEKAAIHALIGADIHRRSVGLRYRGIDDNAVDLAYRQWRRECVVDIANVPRSVG